MKSLNGGYQFILVRFRSGRCVGLCFWGTMSVVLAWCADFDGLVIPHMVHAWALWKAHVRATGGHFSLAAVVANQDLVRFGTYSR